MTFIKRPMINFLKSTKDTYLKLLVVLLVASFLSACASKAKKPEIVITPNAGLSKPVLSPEHQAEYKKALGFMKVKSWGAAGDIFKQLLSVNPKLAGAYVNLALISQAKKDDAQAQVNYHKALEINPNNVAALIQLAAYSQKAGEFKIVEKYLLTAEAIDKTNVTVQYNLAILYELYLQQYDDAIEHYENYVALSTNDDVETVKRWIMLLERK